MSTEAVLERKDIYFNKYQHCCCWITSFNFVWLLKTIKFSTKLFGRLFTSTEKVTV